MASLSSSSLAESERNLNYDSLDSLVISLLSKKDDTGRTDDMLIYLLKNRHVDVGRAELDPPAEGAWRLAYKNEYTKNRTILELLLSSTADLNHQDQYGETVLHMACENQDIDFIRILFMISYVDINIKDYNGNTSLMFLIKEYRPEIISKYAWISGYNWFSRIREITELFFNNPKTDIKVQNRFGNTILHEIISIYIQIEKLTTNSIFAFNQFQLEKIKKNIFNFVKMIIIHWRKTKKQKPSNYNIVNLNRLTILHLLCISKKTELFELWKNPAIDANIQDETGNTALHYILTQRVAPILIVHYLLEEMDADPFLKNNNNLDAEEIASNEPARDLVIKAKRHIISSKSSDIMVSRRITTVAKLKEFLIENGFEERKTVVIPYTAEATLPTGIEGTVDFPDLFFEDLIGGSAPDPQVAALWVDYQVLVDPSGSLSQDSTHSILADENSIDLYGTIEPVTDLSQDSVPSWTDTESPISPLNTQAFP